jgi:nitrosocyanin
MDENTQNTAPANKSNMGMIVGVVVVVALLALGYMLLKGNKTSTAPAATTTTQPTTAPSTAPTTTAMEDVKTVEMEAGSFYYKPNTITVKKGEKVKIVMHAVSMLHNFNIDELNVSMPIVKNGDTGTVEFTADKVGSFEYYCSVGQHRQNGQVGTLTVTE